MMEDRRKIRVLYRKCGSIKEVSRRTGISIPTVRKIVKATEDLQVTYNGSLSSKWGKMAQTKEFWTNTSNFVDTEL